MIISLCCLRFESPKLMHDTVFYFHIWPFDNILTSYSLAKFFLLGEIANESSHNKQRVLQKESNTLQFRAPDCSWFFFSFCLANPWYFWKSHLLEYSVPRVKIWWVPVQFSHEKSEVIQVLHKYCLINSTSHCTLLFFVAFSSIRLEILILPYYFLLVQNNIYASQPSSQPLTKNSA